MDLSPYIESLLRNLNTSAAPAGKEVADAARLLSEALEPSARLSLLDAMSDAAAEITAALEDLSVEARLHGGQIEFIVNDIGSSPGPGPAPSGTESDQSDNAARISLRLPESLKESVETAARHENISANAWLVQVISAAVGGDRRGPFMTRRRGPGHRLKGFARA